MLTFAALLMNTGCKHDPILGEIVDPVDTMTVDTMDPVGIPCEDDVVYFELQILPLLRSSCAVVGCHDEETREDGVVLTSYQNLVETTDVEPFDLEDTEIYEHITDDDPDDRMPPPPRERLDADKILLIAEWILQGAQNLTCDPDPTCDLEDVSFAQDVFPLIDTKCQGCHNEVAANGGVMLTNYTTISQVAASGRLYGAIERLPGYTPMPFNQARLPQCEIDVIKAWIDGGMLDN